MQVKKYLKLFSLSMISVVFLSWTIYEMDVKEPLKKPNGIMLNHTIEEPVAAVDKVFDSLDLDEKGLSFEAFNLAADGFKKLDEKGLLKNDSVLTIIDFDQPSYKKRMFIIDIKNFKILFNTLVAHGKNTGKEVPQSFSNANESHKSSLGFYITDATYNGSKGFSLKLKGVEQGVNNNAMKRAIVIHGASYVSKSYIDAQGHIGRSHGCPAVPMELTHSIIQTIKNGSCLFIYNKTYKPRFRFVMG